MTQLPRAAIPTGQAARGAPVADRRRAAFTLVELLAVIGILMLLLSIGAGAFLKMPRTSRLMATEQLMAGLLRQARHTARTAGTPVVLVLSAQSATVAGITRTVLWTEEFEDPANFPVDPSFQAPQGRTGKGFAIPQGAAPWGPVANCILEREKALRPQDGFYLACSIKLPQAGSAAANSAALILVSAEAGKDSSDPPKMVESTLGVMVWLDGASTFHSSEPAPVLESGPAPVTFSYFTFIGWLGTGSDRIRVQGDVDSLRWPTPDTAADWRTKNTQVRIEAGGRWVEVGLLYDRARLALLVEGRTLAELPVDSPDLLPGQHLYLGQLTSSATTADVITLPADDPASTDPAWILDECRLERLSTGLAGTLPKGVVAEQDARITCYPDGRVRVQLGGSEVAAGSAATLSFKGLNEEQADRATITIGGDGAISSALQFQGR